MNNVMSNIPETTDSPQKVNQNPLSNDIVIEIQNIVKRMIEHNHLDDINLQFNLKTDIKEKGVYAIYLFEATYPEQYNANGVIQGVKTPILRIKLYKNCKYIKVMIKNDFLYKSVDIPHTVVKITKNNNDGKSVFFDYNDKYVFQYISSHIQYAISNYKSAGEMFGCCSSFMECSDARKCVHCNKLYATKCMYKIHLDGGKIFYGKNKNI